MFDSIVLVPILFDDEIFNFTLGFPHTQIKIIPARSQNWDLPVQINRTKGEISGYWDHQITKIKSEADLLFVDFFDWDSNGFLDMSLVLAEIIDYSANPNLIGHRLIVESMYVDIIFSHDHMKTIR